MPQENIHIQQQENDESPRLRIVDDVRSDSDEAVAQFGDFTDKARQLVENYGEEVPVLGYVSTMEAAQRALERAAEQKNKERIQGNATLQDYGRLADGAVKMKLQKDTVAYEAMLEARARRINASQRFSGFDDSKG